MTSQIFHLALTELSDRHSCRLGTTHTMSLIQYRIAIVRPTAIERGTSGYDVGNVA